MLGIEAMIDSGFDPVIGALNTSLNLRLLNQNVISSNIAHHATDPVMPEVFEDPNGVESLDGNTVNRSSEMAKMAENQLLYDASAELLKKKLGMLRYAITEGGG